MSFPQDILKRSSLEQLISFLLYDSALAETDPRPFEERITQAEHCLTELLEQKFPNLAEFNDVFPAIVHCQELYIELGMKLGAQLTMQLLPLNS